MLRVTLKTLLSRLNFVAIIYRSWETCKYITSAAILVFWLPVSSGTVTDSSIEKFDPENIRVAVGILFQASLEADEIHLGGGSFAPLQHKRQKITFNIWGLIKNVHFVRNNNTLILILIDKKYWACGHLTSPRLSDQQNA